MDWARGDFMRAHLWIPLFAGALALFVLSGLHLDLWVGHLLQDWQGGTWALRSAWITRDLIHDGGRTATWALWGVGLAFWLKARLFSPGAAWRRPLGYVLVCTLVSVTVVSLLKRTTHMDCAWDLVDFGGTHAYVGLFEVRAAGLPYGGCFPAGHAGTGYAWTCLYFALLAWRPAWRWRGLAFGLGLGLLFGVGQQLRGAHLLSHDVAALLVCWLVAVLLYAVLLRGRRTAAVPEIVQ